MDANRSLAKPTKRQRFSRWARTVGGGITLGLTGFTAASVVAFWAAGRIDLLLLLPFHHLLSTGFLVTVPNFLLCVVAMAWLSNGPGGRQRGWGWMWLGVAMSALMMSGIFSIYTMGLGGLSYVGHPAVELIAVLAWFSFGCFSGVPAMVLAFVGTMLAKHAETKRWSYLQGVPARETRGECAGN